MRDFKQTWCVRCWWPGRAPFLVGTFFTDFGTPDQEAREAAYICWQDFMADILPTNVPPPEFLELIPGAIIFHPRDPS